MKWLKILIVRVAEFGNPSTKKKQKQNNNNNNKTKQNKTKLTDKGTLLCVLMYFKSNEICLLSHKKKIS